MLTTEQYTDRLLGGSKMLTLRTEVVARDQDQSGGWQLKYRRPTEETVRSGLHFIRMKGNETFKIAVRSLEEVSREALAHAELTTAQVDWFIPHQANQRIIDAVGARLDIPAERCYVNIDRYGNTSAASIPIALDEAVRSGRIVRGNVVLMAAFGAGLTWAASVVRW
jgi:3-oxoacyl-[acyl-carrier-protein] synthase-3